MLGPDFNYRHEPLWTTRNLCSLSLSGANGLTDRLSRTDIAPVAGKPRGLQQNKLQSEFATALCHHKLFFLGFKR
jgi:hypothetical protein